MNLMKRARRSSPIRILILILALILLGGASFFIFGKGERADAPLADGIASLCNKEVSYGLADSDSERKKGLSNRSSLSPSEGLLFVFEESSKPAFWMKDMNFAIDIIWIDENNKIVDITEDFRPETYPETTSPTLPILKVLEVTSGFASLNHCIIGGSVKF